MRLLAPCLAHRGDLSQEHRGYYIVKIVRLHPRHNRSFMNAGLDALNIILHWTAEAKVSEPLAKLVSRY
jgi:hypothetical protein